MKIFQKCLIALKFSFVAEFSKSRCLNKFWKGIKQNAKKVKKYEKGENNRKSLFTLCIPHFNLTNFGRKILKIISWDFFKGFQPKLAGTPVFEFLLKILIFARENSNRKMKVKIARFARNVLRWDFFKWFSNTVWQPECIITAWEFCARDSTSSSIFSAVQSSRCFLKSDFLMLSTWTSFWKTRFDKWSVSGRKACLAVLSVNFFKHLLQSG